MGEVMQHFFLRLMIYYSNASHVHPYNTCLCCTLPLSFIIVLYFVTSSVLRCLSLVLNGIGISWK